MLFRSEDDHFLNIFIKFLIILLCRLLVFGSRCLIYRGLILVPPACVTATSSVSVAPLCLQTVSRNICKLLLLSTAVPSTLWTGLIVFIVVIRAPLLAGNVLVLLFELLLLLISALPTLRAIILSRPSIPLLRLLWHLLFWLSSPFHSVLRCSCLFARVSSAGTSRSLINCL